MTGPSEIEVIRNQDLTPGVSTPGITRHKSFEGPGIIVSQSRIGRGVVSEWHHHGARMLYGHLVSGQLSFDFGPGGARTVELSAGDHFRIPPGLVHRDVNPSGTEEAVVVAVFVGEGPTVVNTTGPDPG